MKNKRRMRRHGIGAIIVEKKSEKQFNPTECNQEVNNGFCFHIKFILLNISVNTK